MKGKKMAKIMKKLKFCIGEPNVDPAKWTKEARQIYLSKNIFKNVPYSEQDYKAYSDAERKDCYGVKDCQELRHKMAEMGFRFYLSTHGDFRDDQPIFDCVFNYQGDRLTLLGGFSVAARENSENLACVISACRALLTMKDKEAK